MYDVSHLHIAVHGEIPSFASVHNSEIMMISVIFLQFALLKATGSPHICINAGGPRRLEAGDETGVREIIAGSSRCVFLQFLLAKDEELAGELAYALAVLWQSSCSTRAVRAQVAAASSPQVAAYLAAGDVISCRREGGRARRLTAFIRRRGRTQKQARRAATDWSVGPDGRKPGTTTD